MELQIRITAEPLADDPRKCKFTADRLVFPGGFARFTDKEKAKSSPLAQRILEIPGLAAVDIDERTVTVTKDSLETWRTVGPAIGAAIRTHLQSGQPALTPEAAANLPPEDKLRAKVQRIFDEQINPAVASHGGTVSLLDVQGNRIFIKMGGGCQGCGMAPVTLREGIEKTLRDLAPEVGELVDVSDHAAGTNPYYASTEK